MNEYQILTQLGNLETEYLYPADGYHICNDGEEHYNSDCFMFEGDNE